MQTNLFLEKTIPGTDFFSTRTDFFYLKFSKTSHYKLDYTKTNYLSLFELILEMANLEVKGLYRRVYVTSEWANHLTFEWGRVCVISGKYILQTDFEEKIILARKYLAEKVSALKRNIFHCL